MKDQTWLRGGRLAAMVLLPFLAVPGSAQEQYMQNGQFRVSWGVPAPVHGPEGRNEELQTKGQPAAWSSDRAVLYWLYDSQNPEGLLRILDGRTLNGHWWLSLAVLTDRPSFWEIAHTETDATWWIWTGRLGEMFPSADLDASMRNLLTLCMRPSDQPTWGQFCIGTSTLTLLPDAWDSEGMIPERHYFENWCAQFNLCPPEGIAVLDASSWPLLLNPTLVIDGMETPIGRGNK